MIICGFHRKIILNNVDADTALPERTRKHAQDCSDCRRVYESQTEIARQLRAGAGFNQREPSPFLHARIMYSIAHSGAGTEQTEMNLVVNNTKTAATALVNNFMPEKLRNSLFEEVQN